MQSSGCSLAPPTEVRLARRPGPDSPVGPPDLVESMWAQREASPTLLQVQSVGLTVDPEPLLRLYEKSIAQENREPCSCRGNDGRQQQCRKLIIGIERIYKV